MNNQQRASKVLEKCFQSGVQSFCLCAGARNAPFVEELSHVSVPVYQFFDERSAAFFALGKIKASGKPVAVVTTSGTAVAELLPATIEAYYSGHPLVLLTADRPPSYRGTGAPQAIEQLSFLKPYLRQQWDVFQEFQSFFKKEEGFIHPFGPSQINTCFEEPLLDKSVYQKNRPSPLEFQKSWPCEEGNQDLLSFLEKKKRLAVIVGELPEEFQESVLCFLKQLDCPVYAEALSGLREKSLDFLWRGSAESWAEALKEFQCDGVLRLGGVPVMRFWRDLEHLSNIDVFSVSHLPFSGLSRDSQLVVGLDNLPFQFSFKNKDQEFIDGICYKNQKAQKKLEES
ncbi:MAG: 2-succinyl-5-enolpyruvyl-6-hydroxy-3-cyclohexene-1-carboxylate synthase, partial [Bdellovibrio sp.]